MSAGGSALAPRTLPVGINIDGVLLHDGLVTPHAHTRFAWIRHSLSLIHI